MWRHEQLAKRQSGDTAEAVHCCFQRMLMVSVEPQSTAQAVVPAARQAAATTAKVAVPAVRQAAAAGARTARATAKIAASSASKAAEQAQAALTHVAQVCALQLYCCCHSDFQACNSASLHHVSVYHDKSS